MDYMSLGCLPRLPQSKHLKWYGGVKPVNTQNGVILVECTASLTLELYYLFRVVLRCCLYYSCSFLFFIISHNCASVSAFPKAHLFLSFCIHLIPKICPGPSISNALNHLSSSFFNNTVSSPYFAPGHNSASNNLMLVLMLIWHPPSYFQVFKEALRHDSTAILVSVLTRQSASFVITGSECVKTFYLFSPAILNDNFARYLACYHHLHVVSVN